MPQYGYIPANNTRFAAHALDESRSWWARDLVAEAARHGFAVGLVAIWATIVASVFCDPGTLAVFIIGQAFIAPAAYRIVQRSMLRAAADTDVVKAYEATIVALNTAADVVDNGLERQLRRNRRTLRLLNRALRAHDRDWDRVTAASRAANMAGRSTIGWTGKMHVLAAEGAGMRRQVADLYDYALISRDTLIEQRRLGHLRKQADDAAVTRAVRNARKRARRLPAPATTAALLTSAEVSTVRSTRETTTPAAR